MANEQSKKKSGGHSRLTIFIIVAILVAIFLAMVAPALAVHLDLGGQIFLRLLQMVVVPLVMASVMSGILGLGDVRKLGRPGGTAVAYYLSTTVLAVATGLVVVNIIRPGVGINKQLVEDARREGELEVKRAISGRGQQSFTWTKGTAQQTRLASTSDILHLHDEHAKVLLVRVAQVGKAADEAVVRVEFMRDRQDADWETLDRPDPPKTADDELVDRTADGVHESKLQLPSAAHKVRLVFEPQTGGSASILSAEVIRGPPTIFDIINNLVLMLFTDNLLESMVEINLLPLIVFSIVFAGMLTTMGNRAETIRSFVVSMNDALMSFILLLMKVAPIGIFCLVAARFGKANLDGQLGELISIQFKYMATVLLGLAVHALVTLPLILWIFTKRNPYRFMMQMSQAVLTAFSTASSTATLPITMECAEVNAGISKRSTEFVLPLGATVNMDGTALYEAAAAIFIAQAFAADLSFVQQLTIAVTATLAAIGAAGIPEAGLVTMLIVLNAVGLPIELIGLILPIDWLLDRFRTAVNAFGDSVGAAIVDPTFESGQATQGG